MHSLLIPAYRRVVSVCFFSHYTSSSFPSCGFSDYRTVPFFFVRVRPNTGVLNLYSSSPFQTSVGLLRILRHKYQRSHGFSASCLLISVQGTVAFLSYPSIPYWTTACIMSWLLYLVALSSSLRLLPASDLDLWLGLYSSLPTSFSKFAFMYLSCLLRIVRQQCFYLVKCF
jgi:hypothetical protein